jgi:hypothetical protein
MIFVSSAAILPKILISPHAESHVSIPHNVCVCVWETKKKDMLLRKSTVTLRKTPGRDRGDLNALTATALIQKFHFCYYHCALSVCRRMEPYRYVTKWKRQERESVPVK